MAALLTLATNDFEPNGDDDYYVPGSPQSPTSDSDATLDFLLHVHGAVFARGGRVLRPPREDEDFDDIVNQIGVPLVFKRHALEQFARLVGCGYPLLLRRPEGWGLNVLVSMLSAALDEDYDDAGDPFVPLFLDQPSEITVGLTVEVDFEFWAGRVFESHHGNHSSTCLRRVVCGGRVPS